ncbi:hypothetical protein [Streptomyces aidingensis]|uniref:Uncharacterized protein n=1 Tax=Streptomyces aidingensis TaxID=910347 RepID=A0A1I1PVD4_9ACTN|nr:hypothetical protein [Streptomyces aidingensis]SFD13809.1 hypothetical protein SAMN05421773_11077 [Streptomyces aidingensis]
MQRTAAPTPQGTPTPIPEPLAQRILNRIGTSTSTTARALITGIVRIEARRWWRDNATVPHMPPPEGGGYWDDHDRRLDQRIAVAQAEQAAEAAVQPLVDHLHATLPVINTRAQYHTAVLDTLTTPAVAA